MWSPATIITPPDGDVIGVEEAKEYLRVDPDDTSLDAQIQRFIGAGVALVERETATRLLTQTVEIAADNFHDFAALPIGPASAIAAITYLDAAGAEQTLDPAAYRLAGAGLQRSIRRAPGAAWPALYDEPGSLRVQLVVGYGAAADIPEPIMVAVLVAVRAMLDGDEPDINIWLTNDRIWF